TSATVVLGETRSTPTEAVRPEIDTIAVTEGKKTYYKLKPTHAEMAPIESAVTGMGEFVEGSSIFADTNGGCRTARYPIRWRIQDISALKAGEQEHCDDFRHAFNITLALYASSINNLAATERLYSTRKSAIETAEQYAGINVSQMLSVYGATRLPHD
ncbi:MAG TPA: hypothetical protein VIV60_21245, partial [Polyangiaceae bacterium]